MDVQFLQSMQMDIRFMLLPRNSCPCHILRRSTLGLVRCILSISAIRPVPRYVHASRAFDVIISATIKAVCFIWTPITTTVSVGARMPSFSSVAIVPKRSSIQDQREADAMENLDVSQPPFGVFFVR